MNGPERCRPRSHCFASSNVFAWALRCILARQVWIHSLRGDTWVLFFFLPPNRCAVLLYLSSRKAQQRAWQLREAGWICCRLIYLFIYFLRVVLLRRIETRHVTNEKFNETLCPGGAESNPRMDYFGSSCYIFGCLSILHNKSVLGPGWPVNTEATQLHCKDLFSEQNCSLEYSPRDGVLEWSWGVWVLQGRLNKGKEPTYSR